MTKAVLSYEQELKIVQWSKHTYNLVGRFSLGRAAPCRSRIHEIRLARGSIDFCKQYAESMFGRQFVWVTEHVKFSDNSFRATAKLDFLMVLPPAAKEQVSQIN